MSLPARCRAAGGRRWWWGGVTHRRVYVGRRVTVGVSQHGDDADHDGLHRVDGQPALLRLLIAKLVLTRLVENRDAHVSVLGHWGEEQEEEDQEPEVWLRL